MNTLGMVLLLALLIPIVALIVDSPIGRAIAGRLERTPEPGTRRDEVIADLRKRLELLEGDVEILQATAEELREENQFVRRLLEEGPHRPSSPTDPA